MTLVNYWLKRKIRKISAEYLSLTVMDNNVLRFDSLRPKEDDFDLYCESLSEFEILEIVKVLVGVYSVFPEIGVTSQLFDRGPQPLNSSSNDSTRFVSAVLNLKSSALHKLLLLTSGEYLTNIEYFDKAMTVESKISLAQNKKEIFFNMSELLNGSMNIEDLEYHYILPGISDETSLFTQEVLRIYRSGSRNGTLESDLRLMAFLSTNSESLTFGENLDLDFSEATKTLGYISHLEIFRAIKRSLQEPYLDLAKSMTASELLCFALIVYDVAIDDGSLGLCPEWLIRSRLSAMFQDFAFSSSFIPRTILRYLSPAERSSIQSSSFTEDVNDLVRTSAYWGCKSVILAALAEVFAVKGENKALEVARELHQIKTLNDGHRENQEAVVMLILEALKPESDEYLFSWFAQFGEYGWMFHSAKQAS